MSSFQLAVDVSNYSGPISEEQARCLRAQGIEHLVAGTQAPNITRAQLAAAGMAGISTDAYVYLYWRRDVREEVAQARGVIAGFPIGRLWLDCEDDAGGLAPSEVVDRILAAVEACGSTPAGIYTGRWWWEPVTANSTRFSHLPLWHAEYTRSAEDRPDFDAFRPYGGWSRPSMWQYRGTTSVCGLSVDLDLREVQSPPLSQAEQDQIDLALFRASQRFDRARALGRFVFRPAGGRASFIELQRVEGGRGVSFDPPYFLEAE